MSFTTFNTETTEFAYLGKNGKIHYATESAATAAITRAINSGKITEEEAKNIAIAQTDEYYRDIEGTRTVQNLMSGTDVEINVNTPRSCDPSSELYWSM